MGTRRGLTWLAAALLVLVATAAVAQSRRLGNGPVRGSDAGAASQTMFPEQSPWLALPTSEDLNVCMPEGDPPAESALVECLVGGKGELIKCDLGKIRDPRMKVVAACVLPKFQAKTRYSGRLVSVPMQFTAEPAP